MKMSSTLALEAITRNLEEIHLDVYQCPNHYLTYVPKTEVVINKLSLKKKIIKSMTREKSISEVITLSRKLIQFLISALIKFVSS